MNYQEILEKVYSEVCAMEQIGKVATYIPELERIDPNKFGIHLLTVGGENFSIGDSNEVFSIQSISKVFALALAFSIKGNEIWKRVGVEPSGNPFNSIVQLEYEKGIPRNPFINAGAIVIADILISNLKNPEKEYLEFVRKLAGNSTINYNKVVLESEKSKAFLNNALANMIKHFGNMENDISEVLHFYYLICCVEMSCKDLAQAFLFFANHGKDDALRGILTKSQIKRINAIMISCGFYDEAGEFAYKVGLPGKSGVGGGIAAIHPGEFSVVVWSPPLNKKGNSYRGFHTLEKLTTESGISIF